MNTIILTSSTPTYRSLRTCNVACRARPVLFVTNFIRRNRRTTQPQTTQQHSYEANIVSFVFKHDRTLSKSNESTSTILFDCVRVRKNRFNALFNRILSQKTGGSRIINPISLQLSVFTFETKSSIKPDTIETFHNLSLSLTYTQTRIT